MGRCLAHDGSAEASYRTRGSKNLSLFVSMIRFSELKRGKKIGLIYGGHIKFQTMSLYGILIVKT